MDERDIMVSDYRVMALTDDGQLVFNWVNQDQGTVSFIPDESDHSSITDEIVNLLSKKGITIKDDVGKESHEKESKPLSNSFDGKDVNNEFEDIDDESSNTNTTKDINPIETTGSDNPTDENDHNQINEDNEKQQTHSEEVETLSFIVRMDNPHERQKAIDSIKNTGLTDSIDRIKLTGPFEMTYKLTESGIELITVEDLGTGVKIDS